MLAMMQRRIIISIVLLTGLLVGVTTATADEFKAIFDGEHLVTNWIDIEYKEVDGGWDVWVKQNSGWGVAGLDWDFNTKTQELLPVKSELYCRQYGCEEQ